MPVQPDLYRPTLPDLLLESARILGMALAVLVFIVAMFLLMWLVMG